MRTVVVAELYNRYKKRRLKEMEIRYLTQEEKAVSRLLYEEVFVEDEEAFVDAYYKIKDRKSVV